MSLGGRISGGAFPRQRPPLWLLLLLGLGTLAWLTWPRPVVVQQVIHQAPERQQVFNAPVRVSIEQHLPAEPGRSIGSQLRAADNVARRTAGHALADLQQPASGSYWADYQRVIQGGQP